MSESRSPKFIDAGSSGEWGWHATELAMKCLQAFAYAHRVKWRKSEEEQDLPKRPGSGDKAALYKGSLVHQGLAHYYARRKDEIDGAATDWATPAEAIEDCAEKLGPAAKQYIPIAKAAVRAYESFYIGEKLTPMHIEEVFSAEVNGYRYTQRLDLVARDASGKVVIIDHKCLPADAVVLTAAGERTVGELVAAGQEWQASAYDTGNLKSSWKTASAPVPAGIQDVWRIKTRGGFGGRFGYKHPILTDRGWVRACDLRPKDRVATSVSCADVEDVSITDPMLYIVGSMICDGGLKTESPIYTKNSEAKLQAMVAVLESVRKSDLDGYSLRRPAKKASHIQVRSTSSVVRELRRLGLLWKGSADKRIPPELLGMSHRQTGVLLGALWGGDGHIGMRKAGASRIVYASRSRGLCTDIQKLLARVGVFSTVTDSSVAYDGSRRGYYFTTVAGNGSKRRFLEKVLSGAIPIVGVDTGLVNTMLVASQGGVHDRFPVDADVAWDVVEAVTLEGQELCYDIEVDKLHTFVAGGLVTHNTTAMLNNLTEVRYSLSGQFLGMATFGREVFGREFGGVVLNLIEMQERGGVMGFDFKRAPIAPAPNALRLFPLTVRHARDRIAQLDTDGIDPWEWPKVLSETTCVNTYGKCEWFECCRWGNV